MSTISRDVCNTPHSAVEVHRSFGGTYCLPLHGTIIRQATIMKHDRHSCIFTFQKKVLPKLFLMTKTEPASEIFNFLNNKVQYMSA
jgi:hypothetical protein